MSNAERFLAAYARIEKKLGEICKETGYKPFQQNLYRASSLNKVVSMNQQTLREYSELRNAIVHDRGGNNEIIAEPCDSVTESIERIADLLEQDNSVLEFASKPVRTVTLKTEIPDAYKIMQEMHTSKLPIYENGSYKGLVTLEEIAGWGIAKDVSKHTVSDILSSSKDDKVLFLPRASSITSVIQGFEGAMNRGSNLLAVIITDKGSLSDEPLGIITVADLPKILKSFV
jgi:predicted transcriptional regulator